MTETSAVTEPPEEVGRNEPCPCGSGKKYKKCCMQAHRVQKEARKSSRTPKDLIGRATSPWRMYKLLTQMRENNMPNLFWQTSHELGPWRARYSKAEDFFEAIGRGDDHMAARDDFELTRIRHDGPDVILLLTRGEHDTHISAVQCEVVTLRPNQFDAERALRSVEEWGFRIWDVQRHECAKADLEGEVRLESLGYTWAEAWRDPT